jgi:hypothetical protein
MEFFSEPPPSFAASAIGTRYADQLKGLAMLRPGE